MESSLKVKKSIQPDFTFEENKQCKKKKKKSKKVKREKLEKNKTKGQQMLKYDADCCESITFTQAPEIKKRKKKKKKDAELNEDFSLLLTQHKKPNLSKQHKQLKDISLPMNLYKFRSIIQPELGEHEPMKPALEELHENSTPKEKTRHKRKVMFNLSPEEILPKSQETPFTQKHFQTQPSCTDRLPSLNVDFSGDGDHSKSTVEENAVASQCTSEDINSQDLFITQKTFLDPCVEISSSNSTDDAAVPPYQNRMHKSPSQEKPSYKQTAEASSQTENFFTSPVYATSFKFHLQRTVSMSTEEPMDLSLPNRSRQEGLYPWDIKPPEDQRHPELKITDITSSDESDILSKGKAGLSQLKVVQTRLNESFFFKVKGTGESPKPRSPLMVLSGCVDKKPKK